MINTGDKIHGFEVISNGKVPTLDAILYEFRDEKTGLTVYWMANEDQDMGFDICFRTPSANNKGIPHILEHSVLGGSQKYPTKDPFFTTLQSSPNTFMNATTHDDRTNYLASSQIVKDFDNLFGIYLDAAFFPLLRKSTFHREGQRLEFPKDGEGEFDTNQPPQPVGIVYNEMKAHYSDADIIGYYAIRSALFANNYGYDSGGVPSEILNLSHQELVDFHKQYYHPSNAAIAFYGKVDIAKYLQQINAEVVAKFDKMQTPTIPDKTAELKPVVREFQLPQNQTETEAQLLIAGFVGPEIKSPHDELDWHALQMLLMSNDYSPMQHALDNSGFGTIAWTYSGLGTDTHVKAMLGVYGATLENKDQLYDLIVNTAKQVIANGVKPETIAYIVKKIAISSRKHLRPTDVTNYIHEAWRYDMDPLLSFDTDTLLAALEQRMQDPQFFNRMLTQLFIDNKYFNFAYLKPVADFASQEQLKVEQLMAQKFQELTDQAKIEIIDICEQITNEVDHPETLPTIEPTDITTKLQRTPQKIVDNKMLQPLNTRGLAFINAYVDLSKLPSELIDYLALFTELVGRIGAGEMNAEEIVGKMEFELGDTIGAEPIIKTSASGEVTKLLLAVGGQSLATDQQKLINYIDLYLQQPNFSEHQPIELVIKEMVQIAESDAVYRGYATAMFAAARLRSTVGKLNHQLFGAGYVQAINQIAKQDITEVISKLQQLSDFIKQADKTIGFTGSEADFEQLQTSTGRQIELATRVETEIDAKIYSELWIGNTNIGYVTQNFAAVNLDSADLPILQVMTSIVGGQFLHKYIREEGGAYGGNANASSNMQQLSFYTIRDPNIVRSIEIFQKAIEWLIAGEFSDKDISNAICKIVGNIDTPQSPKARGAAAALNAIVGISEDLIDLQRSRVLQVTKADVIRVAKQYLENKQLITTVVTGQEQYNQEKDKLGQFEIQRFIQG